MSASDKWREQGNAAYREALTPGLSPTLCDVRLEKALTNYQHALKDATGPEQSSSAAKNIGMATWKLAEIYPQLRKPSVSTKRLYEAAISSLIQAENVGQTRDSTWVTSVKNAQSKCVNSAIEWSVRSSKGRERAAFLESIVNIVRHSHLKAKCYIALGKTLFFQSVEVIGNGNFVTALSVLHDCHYPVEEAARFCKGNPSITSEVEELRQDINTNLQIAESIQATKTGDDMLKQSVEGSEELNIDMLWEAMDWYRKGLIAAREKQVECEAKAHSRIGSIYYKVLMVKEKAKVHFTQCIQLALTLYPRSPENEEWYKSCKQSLDEMQQEVKKEEDSEYQKKRAQYLEDLKDELAELKAMNEKYDKVELLRNIYKRFPPSDKNSKLLNEDKKKWDYDMKKKSLQKAILHYHPDKVDVEAMGMRIKVLHEEITKVFTKHYTSMK